MEVADNSEDEIYHSPANATSTMKDTVVQSSEDTTSSLIGTSEERKNLVDEMMAEYNASLNADKERELQSLKEESRKEALRKRRECRVQNEPSENCQYVIVSVHHLQCGIIKRRFTPDCKVRAVYDWVGSLDTLPEDFSLSLSHPRIKVRPNDNISLVASSVLHMSEENQYLLPDEFIADKRKPEEETTSTACKHDIQGSQYNFQTDDIHILEDISTTPQEYCWKKMKMSL